MRKTNILKNFILVILLTSPVDGVADGEASSVLKVRESCLAAHNERRRQHLNTPDLVYDETLAEQAEVWALHLARSTSGFNLVHSAGSQTGGENLHNSTTSCKADCKDTDIQLTPDFDAMIQWYQEGDSYDYDDETPDASTRNFTQLVWKSTTSVGCGMATVSWGDYRSVITVARYSPSGNVNGEYLDNVMPLKSPCKYGLASNCAYKCNCEDSTEECDAETGKCSVSGCNRKGLPDGFDWSGEDCQTGNVAYGKRAEQAGVYQEGDKSFDADLALDGNTNPDFSRGSCSHTEPGYKGPAWWKVDLGANYRILRVIIFNRDSNGYRLNNMNIYVERETSDDQWRSLLCAHVTEAVPESGISTFDCPQQMVGRFIKVVKEEGLAYYDNQLNICEFVAMGYKYTAAAQWQCKFGAACENPCNCEDASEVCDSQTGECTRSGCKRGEPEGFGWGGAGCLIGNVAYGKPADQCGVFADHLGSYPAKLAVDGDVSPQLSAGSCCHTEPGGCRQAWWRVNLGDDYVILNVTIFNRDSNEYRAKDMTIFVDRESTDGTPPVPQRCAHVSTAVPKGGRATFVCAPPVVGTAIRLVKDADLGHWYNQINICEFVAMGYKFRAYQLQRPGVL